MNITIKDPRWSAVRVRSWVLIGSLVWAWGCGIGLAESAPQTVPSVGSPAEVNIVADVNEASGLTPAPDANVATDANAIEDANAIKDASVVKDANGVTSLEKAAALVPRPVIIRSIQYVGNKEFKAKVLSERIEIELGERFDPFLADRGRRTIIDVYRKIGYVSVDVALDMEKAKQGQLVYVIQEGPRVRVKEVRFVGNKAFSRGSLKKLLKSKERRWLAWPAYYNEDAVRQDCEKLRDFYYKHGYLGYAVTSETSFTPQKDEAILTFVVDEGPQYTVEGITFKGNTHFSEGQLRENMALATGKVYLRDKAEKDAKHMVDLYREQGYIDAEVVQSPKFRADTKDHVVTAEFDIIEGRQFRIGRIDVTGNTSCQDKVVRRVLDEYDFTPGHLYNAKIAHGRGGSQLERYVQRSTVSEQVMIRPVDSASGDPNQKDARVDVTEGMTGVIMPGVGYSSDNGVVGQLVYTQQNFGLTDWPQNWGEFFTMRGFRGEGQTMQIALEPGTQVSRYSVSFTNPYFQDRPISFDLSGRSYTRWLESYSEGRLGGYVGFEHRKWGTWRKLMSLRAEQVNVKDLETDAPQDVLDVAGRNLVLGVKIGTGWNDIDDLYLPSRGSVFRCTYEQVTGDYTYGIVTGSYTHYFPLREDVLERRTVLAAKIQAGSIVGNAPTYDRFYGGGMGQYEIRGFDYRGVSPRGAPQYKDPVGSGWIITSSNEVLIPLISENFSALAFLDGGLIETGNWRWSTGAGIQIQVPQFFGPVPMRFYYGYPLSYDPSDETRRFNFSMGAMLF